MGKRSNFERVERDFYPTPKAAADVLIRHMSKDNHIYVEPCVGKWDLFNHLTEARFHCWYASDINPASEFDVSIDALTIDEQYCGRADYIITNPPWTRSILHPMIEHFRKLRPTWLLIDANWMFTKQAKPYLKYCKEIVNIGRVKWIPDSKYTGKDDCCWYLFDKQETETIFIND